LNFDFRFLYLSTFASHAKKGVFGTYLPMKTLRAGLYARVSTADQQTLPLQMAAMRNTPSGEAGRSVTATASLRVRNIDLLAPVDTVSQKPCFLETEVSGASTTRLPHDNVIKEVDIQNSCGLSDSFGESEVRWRRARES